MSGESGAVGAGYLGDPLRSPEGAAFWNGCAGREFLLQRCGSCAAVQYPWGPVCRRCWSERLDAMPASGRATLWSYTVIDRAPDAQFGAAVPYVVAIVELDEGPRAMTRVVGVAEDSLRPGLRLRVAFARSGSGETVLPVFVADPPPSTVE